MVVSPNWIVTGALLLVTVLTDCGEFDNIHPKEKATVGHRLLLQAMSEVYHKMPRAKASAPMLVTVLGNVTLVIV